MTGEKWVFITVNLQYIFNEEYNKVLSKTCIRQRMNAQCQKIDKIENKVLSKSPIELIFWVLDQLTCLHKTIKKEKK